MAAPQGKQTSSYVEAINRTSHQDMPHPWFDLKEMSEITDSKNNSRELKKK